ncbi:hypothetical protein IRB23SM22_02960 [Alkalibacterium sp. s-m-22]|uniref:DUF3021 domain-containing protein n=1 Tax=Alkalibacterium indicireducens TaxID=398758 RepID=A0ABN1ANZ4_9LACT
MIKNFISSYMNTMTFVFSVVVLLNAALDYFQIINIGNVSLSVLLLAVIIILLCLVSYGTSYLSVKSARVYHVINCGFQLIIFNLVISLFGTFDTSVAGLMMNTVLFIGIYYLSVQRRKRELRQLAQEINHQLAK